MTEDIDDFSRDSDKGAAGFLDILRSDGDFVDRGIDKLGDLLGGLCRALREFTDFLGDDGKSLPASPALAASTPALSASRFVWNAMPSMTVTMFEILSEDSLILAIAETAFCTTMAEFSARCLVFCTSFSARPERSEEVSTVAAICSTAAAASSSDAACFSVRIARSLTASPFAGHCHRSSRLCRGCRPASP